jgi:hypothetical protein
MMMPLSYDAVMTVVDSWDSVKRDPAWMKNFGVLLFDEYVSSSNRPTTELDLVEDLAY